MQQPNLPIKVMIVDDSPTIRSYISRAISKDNSFEIVACAENGNIALSMIKSMAVDVIILDIEMPEMDGLTALPLLLKASPKTKVLMVSALTKQGAAISLKALSLGASDYIPKPSSTIGNSFDLEIIGKVKAIMGIDETLIEIAAEDKLTTVIPTAETLPYELKPNTVSRLKAIAIGCSTGGPQALLHFFKSLKGHLNTIPYIITQHMPPNFTTVFAESISEVSEKPCIEVTKPTTVEPGTIYLAPGGYHMIASQEQSSIILSINQEPEENFCRPAVDPMLRSLAPIYKNTIMTIILTGMGKDGYKGAEVILEHGGSTIAQDQESSVVWGMPGAVATHNLCCNVLPLDAIAAFLINQYGGGR